MYICIYIFKSTRLCGEGVSHFNFKIYACENSFLYILAICISFCEMSPHTLYFVSIELFVYLSFVFIKALYIKSLYPFLS